jgi:anti-sigma B factor antagonist
MGRVVGRGDPWNEGQLEEEQRAASPPSLLSFSIQEDDETSTVSLRGELDMSCTHEVDKIVEALSSRDRTLVVFDLTNLSFLDSTGLSHLVKATWALREEGKNVQVVGARGSVLKVIELTGLSEELRIVR